MSNTYQNLDLDINHMVSSINNEIAIRGGWLTAGPVGPARAAPFDRYFGHPTTIRKNNTGTEILAVASQVLKEGE